MSLKYIVVIFATLIASSTITTNESFAQVTWKTFNERNGLYTIQMPTNWYPIKVAPEYKAAAIHDELFYSGKGNSFAFLDIAFDTSVYNDAKEASDGAIASAANLNDYRLLQPTECEKYTLNGMEACSNVITFQLEDEEQRTELSVFAIDPNGIQHQALFGATNDLYDRFLPVGEYMISSLKADNGKLLTTLDVQPASNNARQQSEIPTDDEIPAIIPGSEIPVIPPNSTANNNNDTEILNNNNSTANNNNDTEILNNDNSTMPNTENNGNFTTFG